MRYIVVATVPDGFLEEPPSVHRTYKEAMSAFLVAVEQASISKEALRDANSELETIETDALLAYNEEEDRRTIPRLGISLMEYFVGHTVYSLHQET